ncbi:hypothetical protein MASR2M78_27410 [Treponema sp.]
MAYILVVDDSFTARSIVARLISDVHQLKMVDGGEAALKALKSEDFDLVLLDLLMPGMDGFQTLAAIQELANKPPVIVISADIQESTHKKVLASGAQSILNKPPKKDLLLGEIEKVLGDGRVS